MEPAHERVIPSFRNSRSRSSKDAVRQDSRIPALSKETRRPQSKDLSLEIKLIAESIHSWKVLSLKLCNTGNMFLGKSVSCFLKCHSGVPEMYPSICYTKIEPKERKRRSIL